MSKRQQTLRTAIAAELARAGLTQVEFAARCGLAQSRVSEFLSGKRAASTGTADKMLAALGLEVLKPEEVLPADDAD